MTPKPRYGRMATMFGSLNNGGHMQIHDIVVSGEGGHRRTGIVTTAVKADFRSDWRVTVEFDGREYPSVEAAIAAYEAQQAGGAAA